MSLQVWLPLTGNLDNNGLNDVTVTAGGSATVNNNGKLGKCYQFGTSAGYIDIPKEAITSCTTECSVAFWVKLNSWNSNYCTLFQAGTTNLSWNDYYFGVLRNAGGTTLVFALGDTTTSTTTNLQTSQLTTGVWYHMAFIYNNKNCKIYINGVLDKEYTNNTIPAFSSTQRISLGCANTRSGYPTDSLMNDFRLYDHALSPLEVKEISQGLVLHYPLNKTAGTPTFANTYPTFDTSSADGGWYHWGTAATSAGTYGQNTDRKYIYYDKDKYSHWVANADTATTNYIVYQSPTFSGGYRSMQAIVKEENGAEITTSICFASWNARSGGLANNTWSSINYLGNGFYLCKAEGIMQDGSNNLIGIYVKPGYKIYVSCCYVENDQQNCTFDCSDMRTVFQDCSGYGYYGVPSGVLHCYNDSHRYDKSIYFNSTGTEYITTSCPSNFGTDDFTISCWVKIPTQTSGTYQTIISSKAQSGASSGIAIYWNVTQNKFLWSTGDDSSSGEVWMAEAVNDIVYDNWIHLVMVRNNSDAKKGYFYINGSRYELASTATIKNIQSTRNFRIGMFYGTRNYSSNMYCNDIRIYRTALLEEDILALYKTGARIDNFGNLHEYEVNELSAPNLVTSLTAGGQTTVIDSGRSVQTSGVSKDTYFIINLTENIISGTSYTLSCIANGIPDGTYPSGGSWLFPLGTQFNTIYFYIHNGYNEIKFTANDIAWGTKRLFMDDLNGPRTSIVIFSNFRLFKNDTSKVEVKQSGIVNASQFVEGSDKTRFFSGGTAYINEIKEV